MIRVALADDQELVRGGLRLLLETDPDLIVVGEADDGGAAVELARRERPDVLLMDVEMPFVDGLTATEIIMADPKLLDVRVVMLTTVAADARMFAALRAGASGYFGKDVEPHELSQGVRQVARGDALPSAAVTRRVIAAFARRPDATVPSLIGLTERENEVFGLVARGLSNAEISARLSMSTATAAAHIDRTMTELGVRDRTQLVIHAYEAGLAITG